jgi:hypothetical protein
MQTPPATPPPSRQLSPAQSIVEISEPVTPAPEKTTLEIVERFIERIEKTAGYTEKNLKTFKGLVVKAIISFRERVKASQLWTSDIQKSISYVQKLTVSPKDLVFIFGDLHGDSSALLFALEKLIDNGVLNDEWELEEHNHLVFLGDYTDRGHYGVEVWFILLTLLEANPDPSQIVMLRGNHESFNLNYNFGEEPGQNGYINELRKKFALQPYKHSPETYNILTHFLYNCLPAALYITCNNERILCSHGGLELGFNPQQLLSAPEQVIFMPIKELKRASEATKLSPKLKTSLERTLGTNALQDFIPQEVSELHFLWSDFSDNRETIPSPRKAGWELGYDLTNALLERDHIRYMFRGHQHTPEYIETLIANKGFYSVEKNPIHTIISFSKIKDFPILCEKYSFIKLEIGETCDAWKAWHMRDGEEIPIQLASALALDPTRKRSEPEAQTPEFSLDELKVPEEEISSFSEYLKKPKK